MPSCEVGGVATARRYPRRVPDRIHVVGISGSLRPGSHTRTVVGRALEGAAEVGATTALVDLRDYQLPFCDGKEDESTYPPDVFRLRREVGAAHGIILGTPEYHSGYSGVLKNAIDLMGFDEFAGKIVGLVGVSGGQMGAAGALTGLRTVGRSLHAWVIPHQASVPEASEILGEDSPRRRRLDERIRQVGRQVARFAFLHGSAQVQEFLREWEASPANPGGG